MNKSVLRRVSPESGTDWHQDGAFLGKGIRTCNVWIALSRCGDVAPGLDIVARRYDEIVETGTEGAVFPLGRLPADGASRPATGRRSPGRCSRPATRCSSTTYCLHRTAVEPAMTEDRLRDRDLVLRARRSTPTRRSPWSSEARDRTAGFGETER